ncbi:MAG: hypothetical protein JW730_16185 [Anaerolineales bacterium]|nr:hypothetical protein [Anaerolineales bacterium]
MKIMVFTEGTIFSHSNWLGLTREEIVQRVREGERHDYIGIIPIGEAPGKIRAWSDAGAEIVYLTSRRSSEEIEQVGDGLHRYGFPAGQLLFRLEGEEYRDVAERALPDILIEDDCESISGEIEMTYPHIRPEVRAKIISIVVKEFGGIDHLPENLSELTSYPHKQSYSSKGL